MAEIVREILVQNELGLHARASAQLVALVAKHKPDFFLKREDTEVNGKSIMGVLMLAAGKGTSVTARAVGADEASLKTLMDAVETLFNNKFGEGR
jgi:phosphocarrier protein HPr